MPYPRWLLSLTSPRKLPLLESYLRLTIVDTLVGCTLLFDRPLCGLVDSQQWSMVGICVLLVRLALYAAHQHQCVFYCLVLSED